MARGRGIDVDFGRGWWYAVAGPSAYGSLPLLNWSPRRITGIDTCVELGAGYNPAIALL